MIPRILERLDKAHQQFSWRELCYGLVPCATLLRWRARSNAGEPLVEKAGPKKKAAVDVEGLRTQIAQLDHGRQRTAGTTALYTQLSDAVSRRRFQELVAQERQNRLYNMKRIDWLVPGVVWSMDTTEYGPEKIKITPLRDLASKYQVPTPLVARQEEGAQIALYLDLMFKKEGAPMFLKRDLGSPLTCRAVDEILEGHRVLPLNSPPGYPRYNGAMERGMRDLHDTLDERRLKALAVPNQRGGGTGHPPTQSPSLAQSGLPDSLPGVSRSGSPSSLARSKRGFPPSRPGALYWNWRNYCDWAVSRPEGWKAVPSAAAMRRKRH